MDCEQAQQQRLPAIFDGLDDDESAAIERHISGCERCRAYDSELDQALRLLGEERAAPRPAVWSALKARIENRAPGAAAGGVTIAVACVYCKGGLARAEAEFCGSCLAPHHPDCFREHGRCANLGCGETRTVKPLPTGGAPRVSAPAPSGKGQGPRSRLRPGFLAMLAVTLAVGGGVGYTAFTARPAPLATPPAAPLPEALSRPVLAPLRSAHRQLLDAQVSDLSFDAQGRPWLSVTDRGQSFYLEDPEALRGFPQADALFARRGGEALDGPWYGDEAFALSIIEASVLSERGARSLLLFRARPHASFGRRLSFVELEDAPDARQHANVVDLAERRLELASGPLSASSFVRLAEAPLIDAWGRSYSREGDRISVRDPWAEGRCPSRIEAAKAIVANPRGSRDDPEPGSLLRIDEAGVTYVLEGAERRYQGRVIQAQALTEGGYLIVFEAEQGCRAIVLRRGGAILKEASAEAVPQAIAALVPDLRERLRPDCVPHGPWQLLWDRRAEALWLLSARGALFHLSYGGLKKVTAPEAGRPFILFEAQGSAWLSLSIARNGLLLFPLTLEASGLVAYARDEREPEDGPRAIRDFDPAWTAVGLIASLPADLQPSVRRWSKTLMILNENQSRVRVGGLLWQIQGGELVARRLGAEGRINGPTTHTGQRLARESMIVYAPSQDRLIVLEKTEALSLFDLSRVDPESPGLRSATKISIPEAGAPLLNVLPPVVCGSEVWLSLSKKEGGVMKSRGQYLVLTLPPRPRFER